MFEVAADRNKKHRKCSRHKNTAKGYLFDQSKYPSPARPPLNVCANSLGGLGEDSHNLVMKAHTHTHTHINTHINTRTQTVTKTHRCTDIQSKRHTHTATQKDSHTDTRIHRRKSKRHTDTRIHRQTGTQIHTDTQSQRQILDIQRLVKSQRSCQLGQNKTDQRRKVQSLIHFV